MSILWKHKKLKNGKQLKNIDPDALKSRLNDALKCDDLEVIKLVISSLLDELED